MRTLLSRLSLLLELIKLQYSAVHHTYTVCGNRQHLYMNKAQIALQHSFQDVFSIYKIPCYVVAGQCGDLNKADQCK